MRCEVDLEAGAITFYALRLRSVSGNGDHSYVDSQINSGIDSWGIGGGRTSGMVRVLLRPCFEGHHLRLKGPHPFFLVPSHSQQVDDQLLERQQASVPMWWDQAAVLRAVGGRQPRQRPSRCAAMFPWVVNATLIIKNPANFQQKLVDEPGVAILHFYPLQAYKIGAPESDRSHQCLYRAFARASGCRRTPTPRARRCPLLHKRPLHLVPTSPSVTDLPGSAGVPSRAPPGCPAID